MLYSSIVKKRIRQSFDHLNNHANSWGRKSLLLIGFGALPIRAALFTVSDNEVWLVSLQVLDGVAAGTLDALIPLVLADVMLGTGRYRCAGHRARDSVSVYTQVLASGEAREVFRCLTFKGLMTRSRKQARTASMPL